MLDFLTNIMFVYLNKRNIFLCVFIFYNMKISHQFFRKYIANFAIILALAFVGILTYSGGAIGAFSSTNKTDIIYSGNVSNNTISLMFNVYMGNEYVEQILNILKENNAKATFFVG